MDLIYDIFVKELCKFPLTIYTHHEPLQETANLFLTSKHNVVHSVGNGSNLLLIFVKKLYKFPLTIYNIHS